MFLYCDCYYDTGLVPSRYLIVFWDERRLGIRLGARWVSWEGKKEKYTKGRRKNSVAIFPSSLLMRPRACLNLIPNLLSSQKNT